MPFWFCLWGGGFAQMVSKAQFGLGGEKTDHLGKPLPWGISARRERINPFHNKRFSFESSIRFDYKPGDFENMLNQKPPPVPSKRVVTQSLKSFECCLNFFFLFRRTLILVSWTTWLFQTNSECSPLKLMQFGAFRLSKKNPTKSTKKC